MSIPLITTCDPLHFHLIRPFVEHYRAYGVVDFYINLHFDINYAPETFYFYTDQANGILSGLGLKLHSVYACPFDAMAIREHHDKIQALLTVAHPWMVSADIDEFHEFPDEIEKVTRFMEAHHMDYIRGGLVDRLARRGFPPFDPAMPIWQQFPLGSDLTRSVLRGWVDKVVLHRSHIALLPGHHKPQPNQSLRAFPESQPIHHFKWDASVLPRLKRRLQTDWRQRCPWWIETDKALRWMESGAAEELSGLRVFDFEDDRSVNFGPHSENKKYLYNKTARAM